MNQQRIAYNSTDGTALTAWIVPAAHADSSGMRMLICYGNYGNIGYEQRPEFYACARDLGLNLFAFEYRGFGDSAGEADESGCTRTRWHRVAISPIRCTCQRR